MGALLGGVLLLVFVRVWVNFLRMIAKLKLSVSIMFVSCRMVSSLGVCFIEVCVLRMVSSSIVRMLVSVLVVARVDSFVSRTMVRMVFLVGFIIVL